MRLTRRGRIVLYTVIFSAAFFVGVLSGPYYIAGH